MLIDKKIKNLSDIAVLGKKEKSLEEFSLNLGIENRLFIDTPLINIGTESAEIYSDLLRYKHNSILTAQEVIERYFWQFESFKIQEVKQILKRIRTENCLELFIENCNEILILLGYENTDTENAAVRDIWNNESLLKLFKPLSNNEVQLMTLHKSKGLEFEIVFHIDLEEWSFPYRIPGKNWDDIIYPSLSEDTNLHYVGITRAVQYCILVHTTQRKNANDEYKNSQPSYFFNLTELEGLYKNIQHQELKSYTRSNFTY